MTPELTLDTPLSFISRFVCGDKTRAPLLLLHGTGGDENDLLPLGRMIAPGRTLLSVRGRVLENGMPRFFRRFAEGVFDLDNLNAEADALAAFVTEARQAYGLSAPIAVGFSNGANIAAATMLKHPSAFAGAVLIRAMHTIEPPVADEALTSVPVLVLSGQMDPIVPAASREALVSALAMRSAQVRPVVLPAGHALTQFDVSQATTFLDAL